MKRKVKYWLIPTLNIGRLFMGKTVDEKIFLNFTMNLVRI